MNEVPIFRCSSASETNVGPRHPVNEDASVERFLENAGLWAVADGMGGHDAGDVASAMIVEALQEVDTPSNLGDFIEDVERRLDGVHRQLGEMGAGVVEGKVIGSTVAALLAYRRQGACIWAGDSRIYRLRDGMLQQLTRDHSEVEELIERGQLKREEAADYPYGNVLTRAVGGPEELALAVKFQELRSGDRFLLCSDGLTKVLSETDMAELLTGEGDPQQACRSLIQLAVERECPDDVTAIVVHLEETS